MYLYNLGLKFYEVAEENADRTCLLFDESERYSFAEVNRLSNQIGAFFLHFGIKAQEVVCIAGEKTLFTYATILACLKTGVIYSIFDSDSPTERLRRIFTKCEPRIIIYPEGLSSVSLGETELEGCRALFWDASLKREISRLPSSNLDATRSVTGDFASYIMFTSGSTGFPKGAVMTHANVLNLISWSCATYGFGPDERLTNLNPLYFDNSVFDLYSAFFSGAALVPFSKQEVADPARLMDKIDRCRCTSWFSVPSLLIYLQTLKMLEPSNLGPIRRIIFGGEGYPKTKLRSLFALYKDRIAFHNVYGPTECTCICSTHPVLERDFDDMNGFLPLGHVNGNFSSLIIDGDNQRLGQDVVGELCLMGPCVGKGYYNDTDRTHVSFVQNPCNDRYPEIMYKTGDLVMMNSRDGKLYISGRKDNQIKHMGYRIELEEIENAIYSLKDIHQSAVVHTVVNEISQLIAFVSSSSSLNEHEIRKQLRNIIPAYMIPTRYHFLERLPTNANGKVDRVKLKELYC